MIRKAASLLFVLGVAGLGFARGEDVISTTQCKLDGFKNPVTVEIVMTEGKLHDDLEPWCGDGEKWEGQFQIRVRAEHGLLSSASLNKLLYPQEPAMPASFWTPKFKLSLHDYNDDGLLDFNLGQYGACLWNNYRIFTIRRDGTVQELPCKAAHRDGIAVSWTRHTNSTPEIKVRHGRMVSNTYDQDQHTNLAEERIWKRGEFVLVSSKPALRPGE